MSFLGFATYGLVVEADTFLDYTQLFTLYRGLKKKLKKKRTFKINFSCIIPYTKKPVSARMGKGKGAWRGFHVFLRKGSILLEISDMNYYKLQLLLKECMNKLPVKTKIVKLKI